MSSYAPLPSADPTSAASIAAASSYPAAIGGAASSNYVPKQLDRHLQSLCFNHEGHLLLGCSSLTTRFWTGSLWYYRSPADAPSVDNCLTGIDLDNGLFEAIFIGDSGKQILAALDNGSIEHFNLSFSDEDAGQSFHFLEHTNTINEHNDLITGIVKTFDGKAMVTSSYDRSMVIHDLPTLAKRRELINAHEDLILSVDTSKVNPQVFFSSSQDGKVALWDMRGQESKSVVYDDPGLAPTVVQCLPGEENFVVVGTSSGQIGLYDIRQPKKVFCVDKSYDQQIYKIRFSHGRPNLFAVGADSSVVSVFSVDVHSDTPFESRYANVNRHTDFIRGVAWHPDDTLWTCGWDKTVLSHMIP